MDNNTVDTEIVKEKKKRRIPLIWVIVASSLLVAAGAVSAVFLGGQKGGADTSAFDKLAKALAAYDDAEITISEDIDVTGLMFVNGNKTLSGDGTLRVTGDIGEYILVINDGASLTINGPTIDGAENAANGIYVSPDAGFSFSKGLLTNLRGHGVRVLGSAAFSGGKISNVGTNWLMVDEGAAVNISAAEFSGSKDSGILTALGSQVSLGEGVKLSGSESFLVYNAGTMDVTSGSYTGSGNYAFHNEGSLVINSTDFDGAEALGYIENESASDVEMHGGSMTNSKADFIFNKGTMLLEGVKMNSCRSTAIETRGADSALTIIDCSMDNIGKNALLCKTGVVNAENLSIGECGGCGIHSRGSEFNGKNVTVASAGDIAIYNNSVSDSDATVGNITLTGFEIGTAKSYCIRTNGGEMTLNNGTVGKGDSYGLYIKNGTVTTNYVDFLGTNDEDRCVVQVGLSKTPAGKLTFNETTVTGGAKGVTNHGEFVFNSGKIYGNKATGTATGAGVYNSGTFTMNGGTISGNTSKGSGAGLSNSKGTVIINGGSISGNSSQKYGGGVYNSGTLTMNGGTISGNYGYSGGGGIEVTGITYLYGGSVSDNTSGNGGGGVYIGSKGTLHLGGAKISGNRSSNGKSGGGVSVNGGTCYIYSGAKISGNYSDSNGGGVYNYGTLVISGGEISGNAAVKNGGGIANSSYTSDSGVKHTGCLKISNVTVSYNLCLKTGGGVYNSAEMDIKGGNYIANHAIENGGGIATTSDALISGSNIDDNISEADGGGIHVSSKAGVILEQLSVSGNNCGASCKGAGLCNEGETEIFTGCEFTSNGTPDTLGGGIYNGKTLYLASETSVSGNTGKEHMANICNNAVITPLGKQNLTDVYFMTGAYFKLDSALKSGSEVELWMEKFEFGELVLSGKAGDIGATVDYIVLRDNDELSEEDRLSIDPASGVLSSGDPESDEAQIVDAGGIEIASGSLAEMIAAAAGKDNVTIKLLKHCTINTALTPSVAIKLDGNGKTILFSDAAAGLSLTGKGNSIENLTIKTSCELTSSPLYINSGATAEVSGCSFVSCRCSGNGGAVNNQGTLVIKDSSFKSCETSSQYGGAVYNGSKIEIHDCSFTGNKATGDSAYGGSVYMKKDSESLIENVTASNGTAKYGKDFYTNGTCTISGKINIDAFHIASGKFLTLGGELDEDSTIGVKIASDNFKSGTVIIKAASGSEAYLEAATKKISLLNDVEGTSGIYLGTEGVLVFGGEAELLKDGKRVMVGPLSDVLKSANNGDGDTVRLIANADLSSSIIINVPITITSKSSAYTLKFSGSGSGITFTQTSSVKNIQLSATEKDRTTSLLTASDAALSLSGVTIDYVSSSDAYAVEATGSSSVTVTKCSFKDTAGGAVNNQALRCIAGSSLNITGSSFENGLGYSVGSDFKVSKVTLSGPFEFTCVPDDASTMSVTYSTYAAGTTVYTWSFSAGTTAEAVEDCFNDHYTVTNKASSGLNIIPVIDSRTAILKADVEAELYRNGSKIDSGSLAGMIGNAIAGDTVKLLSDSTIESKIAISKNITLEGNGKKIIVASASGNITVSKGTVTAINNVTLTSNCTLSSSAITVSSGAELNCHNCSFIGLSSSGAPAAIKNNGSLYIENGTFSGCNASYAYGGALYNSGSAEIVSSTFTNNQSDKYGGAIYSKSELSLTSTDIYDNNTDGKNVGKDLYSNGVLIVSDKIRIDDLFLYNGHRITTAGITDNSTIRVSMPDSFFKDGTVVVDADDSLTSNAADAIAGTVERITLSENEGKSDSDIMLLSSGELYCKYEAMMKLSNDEIKKASLSDMLEMVKNGDLQGSEIILIKNAIVDSSAVIPDGITLNGKDYSVELTSEAKLSIAEGSNVIIKDISITGGTISNKGTLEVTATGFSSCNVFSDSVISLKSTTFDAASTLTVSGTVTADITAGSTVFVGKLEKGSALNITTSSYDEGSVIVARTGDIDDDTLGLYITGNSDKDIGKTIILANDSGSSIPRYLLGDGKNHGDINGDNIVDDNDITPLGTLYNNPAATAEAYLYESEKFVEYGDFSEIWEKVQDEENAEYKIVLNQTPANSINIINSKIVTLDLNKKTLSGDGKASVIKNESGATLRVMNGAITMPDGSAYEGKGGGIYNIGTLNLTNVVISNCSVTGNGGGIYNSGTLYLTTVTVSNCHAGGDGGGIYNYKSATLTNVNITGCSAVGNGGALCNGSSDGTATININGLNTSDNKDKSENDSRDLYFTSGSSAEISGANISKNVHVFAAKGKNAVLTISGGTFEGKITKSQTASITITGGSFKNDPSAYVDTTLYKVTETDEYFVVESNTNSSLAESDEEDATTEEDEAEVKEEEEAVKEEEASEEEEAATEDDTPSAEDDAATDNGAGSDEAGDEDPAAVDLPDEEVPLAGSVPQAEPETENAANLTSEAVEEPVQSDEPAPSSPEAEETVDENL